MVQERLVSTVTFPFPKVPQLLHKTECKSDVKLHCQYDQELSQKIYNKKAPHKIRLYLPPNPKPHSHLRRILPRLLLHR